MRRLVLLIGVAFALVLQVGFIPALHPFGVVPNIILALVVLVGLMGTATAALSIAVAGGLVLDLTSGDDFGLRLGLLVLVALACGMVHRAGWSLGGPAVALALTAAATLLAQVTVLAGLAGVAVRWPLDVIATTLWWELALNLMLVMLLRPLVRWTLPGESGLPVAVRR